MTDRARTAGVVLVWLVAVGVATLAGMAAVGAVGQGLLNGPERPLRQQEINSSLAQQRPSSTSATPGPATTQPPPQAPASTSKVFGTQGGTVIARCTPAGGIEVVSASPAQGYGLKDVEAEDGGQRVRFETGRTRVEVQLTCVSGQPQASTRVN
jgi:hypothetical protein